MKSHYAAVDNLQQHKAQLRDSIWLDSDVQLAAWYNCNDRVQQYNQHHILSLYLADGVETYRRTVDGWRNGGGPDRFCLMPSQAEYTWDIRGSLSFAHLYYTDAHLRDIAQRIWDRSPAGIELDERIFAADPQIAVIFRHFLLSVDWQQAANQLQLSSATTLLLTHIIQHHSAVRWRTPGVSGGLAPVVLRRVQEWVQENLDAPLTLGQMAAQAGLSEYHFARMFRQSVGMAPHQYVMAQRMALAERMVRDGHLPFTEIALACGFSSASHFSNRFRATFGMTPSQLRGARTA
ncbi:AraC family transcriptional regulator [Salmonella enterica subsp. enterica serovar Choleraesuis]|nr:AraC family transcriptional regulator [Salmonella enterica subsp. enterica serovar Choleraesuis]